MKKLALVALIGVLCSILLAACGSSSNSGNGGNTSNSGNSCDPTHVTMTANTYCEDTITITKGSTITFIDDKNSGTEHILVIGKNGSAAAEQGAPDFGSNGKTFQAGDSWTTAAWNTTGTFHVTCTIHPTTMNLTITVQ